MWVSSSRWLAMIVVMAGGWGANSSWATLYTGSGTSSFGGALGGSQMSWSDDGSTVTVDFTKGSGNFDKVMVLYLDTVAGGRSSIDSNVNDRGDTLRSGISYMEAGTGRSLTFSSGFEADYAIAINTEFGGLWSIPPSGAVGNNGLGYVAGVGNPANTTDSSFSFTFDLADIGLSPNSGDSFEFLATYIDPFGGIGNLGYASNEGYGSGFPAGDIGQANFSFTGSPLTYVSAIPEASPLLLGGLVAALVGLVWSGRRLHSRRCPAQSAQ